MTRLIALVTFFSYGITAFHHADFYGVSTMDWIALSW